MKALGIIPARAGSKRLPRKNLKPFLGKPLIQWTIAFAQRAQCFSHIVVSTDSDEIAQCAERAGLAVPDRRPPQLATDSASSVDVALHCLAAAELAAEAPFDAVALLQPTSPLRSLARWRAAFDLLEHDTCDAAVGVSPPGLNMNHVVTVGLDGALSYGRSESMDTPAPSRGSAFAINGSLYLITAAALRRDHTFFPKKTRAILCEVAWEAIDIDTEADWVAAEALARDYGICE